MCVFFFFFFQKNDTDRMYVNVLYVPGKANEKSWDEYSITNPSLLFHIDERTKAGGT